MAYPTKPDLRALRAHLEDQLDRPIENESYRNSQMHEAIVDFLRLHQDQLQPRRQAVLTAWPSSEPIWQATAALQLLVAEAGFEVGDIDGYWGPRTDAGVEQWRHLLHYGTAPGQWRDALEADRRAERWPKDDDAALEQYYGRPGDQLTQIETPYPLRLAWDVSVEVNRITVHRKVAESVSRVLAKVVETYGLDDIAKYRLDLYGGCYNNRARRGGRRRSTHAWAAAIDWDPDHNRLQWGRDRASFAKPQYDEWWRLWEDEGWTSLGRRYNFDWMHVQAVS